MYARRTTPTTHALLLLSLLLPAAGCDDNKKKADAGPEQDLRRSDGPAVVADLGPLVMTTLKGGVFSGEDEATVTGAKVSVLSGAPAAETTTDASGRYSLPIAAERPVFVLVAKDSFIPTQRGVVAPPTGLSNADLPLVPTAFMQQKVKEAGFASRDPAKGMVVVVFEHARGGEGATLSAANAGSLSMGQDGKAVKSTTVVEGGIGALIFLDVAPGTTTVALSPTSCVPRFPQITEHPVTADRLTVVGVDCPNLSDGGQGDWRLPDGGPSPDLGPVPDSGPAQAAVSGKVFNGETEAAIAGALVAVVGASPSITTTSGSTGNFSLQLTVGSEPVLRATLASYLSSQMAVLVAGGGLTQVELPLSSHAYVDQLMSQASLPTRDAGKGIVALILDGAAGSEAPTIGASHGGSMAMNSSGDGVASSSIIAGGPPVLIFVNVTPGTTTASLSGAAGCALRFPSLASHPVTADTLTVIPGTCTP